MIKIKRQLVEDAMYSAGLDDDALRTDYSGRGMYGETCWGLILSSLGEFANFMVALGALCNENDSSDENLGYLIADNVVTDSMGFDTIYYFPRLELVED